MAQGRIELDHIAVGVPQVAGVVPVVVGVLGGRPRGAGPGRGFRFWQWEFAGGGALEVLEPDGPPGGFLHRFLAKRGPGVHHVTFKLPDIRAAMDHARAQGFEVVGFDDSSPTWIEAFLHPKSAPGVVVQIVESHPPEGGTDGPETPYPPAPEAPPEPVRLLGLHLGARDERRARRLFEDLLGGECSAQRGRHVYRWPGSPLRIALTLDPARDEGALALEVAAARPLALPPKALTQIGVEIARVEEDRG
jgi:methylmalonyl-CoA/ethylmalonyl-CoA epimerase